MGGLAMLAARCITAALALVGLAGAMAHADQRPRAQTATVASAQAPPIQVPPGEVLRIASAQDLAHVWGRLNTIQRLDAITELIRMRALDDAETYLTRVDPVQPLHRLEVEFLTGVLRRSQGRTDDAVKIFRGLLVAHPGFDRVRLELGYALFQKQDDEAARHHFELVLGATPSSDAATSIQGFLDAMDRRRRWQFTSYFSLAPSTNLNQGTTARIMSIGDFDFAIDSQARKQSGVGLYYGGTGSYSWSLAETLDLVLGGGAQARDFRAATYDDVVASMEFGPRIRFDAGEVMVAGTVARRWFAGDGHSVIYGARTQTRMRLDQRYLATFSTACVTKHYDNPGAADARNCSLTASVDYGFDTQSYLRVLGGIEVERTAAPHLTYIEASAGLGGFRELEWGVSVYTQARVAERSFDGYAPGTSTARRDRRLETSIHLTKRDLEIFSFAPSLEYTFTLNRSNIGHHSYDGHGINLTMTKRY